MWSNFLQIIKRQGTAVLEKFIGSVAAAGAVAAFVGLAILWDRYIPLEKLKEVVIQIAPFMAGLIVAVIAYGFWRTVSGLQNESKEYARKISRRDSTTSIEALGARLTVSSSGANSKLRRTISELQEELASLKSAPTPIDTSDPEKIFQVGRQRLLDEAVRIDSISRRNLIIGIMFSVIALAVLAWPLVTAAFAQRFDAGESFNVLTWAAQYYLPRFAVGILLQFVGFFFLRLYVANELDLKHNKNEITNLEMKMMGLQLAKEFGDGPSRKEIVKSLASTERNFIIKKNEKSVSMEALSEYNDLKGILEKLISKIPGSSK